MRNSTLFILLSIFILSFCGQKQNKPQAIKDITFPINSNYRGSISIVNGKEELICFSDVATRKTIKMYSLDGKLLDSIPLNQALNYLGSIDGINIVSKDTIIINSQYTNKIVVINHLGECWHKPNINPQIIDSNQNVYEISNSRLINYKYNVNPIIYHSSYRYNINERLNNKEPAEHFESVKHYYDKSYESAYLVRIDSFFSKTPKLRFAFYDFYKRISSVAAALVGSISYKSDNKFTYVFSCNSDKLFVLNTHTLEVLKEVRIASKYTNVGMPAMQINKETVGQLQEYVNKSINTKGSISQIFYNSTENKYYLIVLHDVTDEKEKLRQHPTRHFSVIVYDDNFENPTEYAFVDQKYRHYPIIMSSEGLMIAKMPPKSKVYDNLVFTVFKF